MKRLHEAWLEVIVTCAEVANFLFPRTWFDRWLVLCARCEYETFKAKWGEP